jgi:hypothetical protein
MATPTATEIVAAIDTLAYQFAQGATAVESQVLGRRVRKAELTHLLALRRYYVSIARDDADDGTGSTALIEFGGPV